jgi:hypothetical protein
MEVRVDGRLPEPVGAGRNVLCAIAYVAREIQVNEGTHLREGVNKYRVEHVDEEPPLSVSARARLRELEREGT